MRETTERELKKLRNYCRSPDANWMKITRSVHDPKKYFPSLFLYFVACFFCVAVK